MGWRAVTREFDLPPGVAQARIVVRDPASEALGAVSHRFEVPAARTLRLGTPIVTDQVVPPSGDQGRPHAALAVHRAFDRARPSTASSRCSGPLATPTARPTSLRACRCAPPTARWCARPPPRALPPTATAARVRLLGLGLEGLSEGAYELVLDVRDEVGLGRLERREPFTIAR